MFGAISNLRILLYAASNLFFFWDRLFLGTAGLCRETDFFLRFFRGVQLVGAVMGEFCRLGLMMADPE